jgi:hypothetical protein
MYGVGYGMDCTLFKSISNFCIGKNEAVVNFIEHIVKNSSLVFVGESVKSMGIYQYTGSLPTFRKIWPGAVLKHFQEIVHSIFLKIPQEIASTAALEEIVKYFETKHLMPDETFSEKLQPMGVPKCIRYTQYER